MNRRTFFAAAAAPVLAHPSGGRFQKGIWYMRSPEKPPYAEAFRRFKDAGFDGVDIRLGDEIKLSSTEDEVKRIFGQAREAGLAIVSMYAAEGLNDNRLNDPSPAVRARGVAAIERAIEIATWMDHCPLLLVPGRVGSGAKFDIGYQDTWDRTSAELQKVVPRAAAAKVIIGPENMGNKFLLSPLEMRAYVDQFRSPWVRVHFDVGNPMRWGYPQDWILTLGARIARVHLKDFKLPSRGAQGGSVDLLEGDVDWKEVMAALVKVGYRGFLSLEAGVDPRDSQRLAKLSRAVDKIFEMA